VDGKWEEALPHYEQAAKLDPEMGRAYAGYAVASLNLGRRGDADKYFREALTHIDRMTDREKYRTRGSYFILLGEPAKAIDEYSALLRAYPYDDADIPIWRFLISIRGKCKGPSKKGVAM